MKPLSTKLIVIFALLFISFNSYCQEIDSSKILGKWIFNKIEFLSPMPDSLKMIEDATGATLTFIKGNKVISKSKAGGVPKEETYSYKIEGKYMIQGKERVEIITLNDKEFIVQIPELFTIYLLKAEEPK